MPETPKPDLTHAERIFIRISVLQTVLAVVGIFTGAVALYAALNEADAVRKQQQSAVWPYIGLSTVNFDRERRAPIFQFRLTNSGVGPARIHSVHVRVDDRTVKNWNSAVMALSGDTGAPVFSDYVNSRVVQSGETVDMMTVYDQDLARELDKQSSRIDIEICYCSIFDECWIKRHGDRIVEQTRMCAISPDDQFEN